MDQVVLHVLQVGDVGKVSNKIRPKKKKKIFLMEKVRISQITFTSWPGVTIMENY